MYDYMKALADRFAPTPKDGGQCQELEAKRQAVSSLLDKQGRKKLLRLVDAHTAVQEEMALNSFIAGFRLAWGIATELGKTQTEIKEKLAAAQQECQGLDVARTEAYTVATWLRTWYDLYAQPNIRLATADRYRLMIETHTIPRIGKIKLKKLTSRDLQKLYKNLMEHGWVNHRSGNGNPGLSSTTVRSVHLMLHSAFERAVKERLAVWVTVWVSPVDPHFDPHKIVPIHNKKHPKSEDFRCFLELLSRFELETSSLPNPRLLIFPLKSYRCLLPQAQLYQAFADFSKLYLTVSC